MSSFDPSMEPMLEMFIYESTTLLEQLDDILMESEKKDSISEDHINEIFRIMHTIKGSSAMMGLESISNLSHAVEDVFFIIRDHPDKLEHISGAIFDIVFQVSDFLKVEVGNVQDDNYLPRDPSAIIEQLEKQVGLLKGTAPSPPKKSSSFATNAVATPAASDAVTATIVEETPPSTAESSTDTYQVRVFFEDGCQMENIRAFMLMSQLKDWCEELESVPDHPENDASVSNDIIKNGFLISFVPTGSPEDVYKVVENAINIKTYEIIDTSAPVIPEADVPVVHIAQSIDASGFTAPADNTSADFEKALDTASSPAAVQFQSKSAKQSLISVNQTKLDQLMDLVGELVTTESMVASNPDLKGLVLDNFNKSTRELRKLTDELQDVVMSIRMVPLSGVFQKMNRIVRDMSKKLNKLVTLETVGGDTEVDKTINDSITDPFMHMIRNAMDHAIESPEERLALGKPEAGTITIAAKNVGGEIIITIADNGRGLDSEKIMKKAIKNNILVKPESEYSENEIFNLIMLPGFSTNEVVTEYSGRGVGMDVVRKNIDKVGGIITVDSVKNVGTTFTVKIPLTLAIVDGMEISVGDTIFTLPITSIKQSFKIFEDEQVIHNTDGREMIMLRGECYPILRLHELFGIPTEINELTGGIVIQISNDHKVACIFADELLGEQQVVVKPFPVFLNRYNIKGNGLSGCTILGDGSISLILDANSLLNLYER